MSSDRMEGEGDVDTTSPIRVPPPLHVSEGMHMSDSLDASVETKSY